jgi:hypothetical protein
MNAIHSFLFDLWFSIKYWYVRIVFRVVGTIAWYLTHDNYAWFSDEDWVYVNLPLVRGRKLCMSHEVGCNLMNVWISKPHRYAPCPVCGDPNDEPICPACWNDRYGQYRNY